MKRLAIVDLATDRVVGMWAGGDEQDLSLNVGYAAVTLADGDPEVLGYTWSGAKTFTAPAPRKELSKLAFYNRFTRAERDAIRAAREIDAGLADWWTQFEVADSINLDDPRVALGLDYLTAQRYIAAGRKAELLVWP